MDERTKARFWAKVEKTDGCWNWTAAKHDGYGVFGIGSCRRALRAHRLAWEDAFGSIPEGMCILHYCDNRGCVRPSHLFIGTRADNQADMAQKGRQARGEQHWNAKLTVASVLAIREEYANGGQTQEAIGIKYGISHTVVSRVVGGHMWRHVE